MLHVPGVGTAVENETNCSQHEAERDWARRAGIFEEGWWRVEAVKMRADVMERWLKEREEELTIDESKRFEQTITRTGLRQPGISSNQAQVSVLTTIASEQSKEDEAATLDAFFARKDRKGKKKTKKVKKQQNKEQH